MTPAALLLGLRVLLAVVLYGFLGFLLLGLWRDLRSTVSSVGQAPAAHLIIENGPHAGKELPLRHTTAVGRVAGNSVRLSDETVSAKHARLSFHGGQWWLEDLASRNGTMVNGLSVEEPLVVTYGDEIHFGRVQVRLEAGESEGGPSRTGGAEATAPVAPASGSGSAKGADRTAA